MLSPRSAHPKRAAAVDDEHAAVARLRDARAKQHVVLEAAHRRDRAGEGTHAAELPELRLARRSARVRVEEVGGASCDLQRADLEQVACELARLAAQVDRLALREVLTSRDARHSLVERRRAVEPDEDGRRLDV